MCFCCLYITVTCLCDIIISLNTLVHYLGGGTPHYDQCLWLVAPHFWCCVLTACIYLTECLGVYSTNFAYTITCWIHSFPWYVCFIPTGNKLWPLLTLSIWIHCHLFNIKWAAATCLQVNLCTIDNSLFYLWLYCGWWCREHADEARLFTEFSQETQVLCFMWKWIRSTLYQVIPTPLTNVSLPQDVNFLAPDDNLQNIQLLSL